MKKRNWLDLSRKLVDRFDFNYTLDGMSEILGLYALSFFGEGVLDTTIYPNPFPIVLSGSAFTGTVGNGIAYDPAGNFTEIYDGPANFNLTASDASNPRKDLLVLRYKTKGDSLIPKPSDPLSMVYLNLLDYYELAIVPGVAAGIPAYPAKGASDVILAGIQVPANATIGTQCVIDISIREVGRPDVVHFPSIKQEAMGGVVDGTNKTFTTSKKPSSNSLIIFVNGIVSDFTIVSDTSFLLSDAPGLGQSVDCFYIAEDTSSTNPLQMFQERPIGASDGVNQIFVLTGKTANKDSTFVFVDGVYSYPSEWSLIQSPTGDSIKFNSPDVPAKGQPVYVAYFVNPKVAGSAPSGGGGGGNGGYVVSGSPVPIVIDPAAGVVVTTDQRQMQFAQGQGGGGGQEVTANPQIAPGTIVGQELLLHGMSDDDYPIFNNGNGLKINGTCNLKSMETLKVFWTGIVWSEEARSV